MWTVITARRRVLGKKARPAAAMLQRVVVLPRWCYKTRQEAAAATFCCARRKSIGSHPFVMVTNGDWWHNRHKRAMHACMFSCVLACVSMRCMCVCVCARLYDGVCMYVNVCACLPVCECARECVMCMFASQCVRRSVRAWSVRVWKIKKAMSSILVKSF